MRISRLVLWSIILLLLITNITTFLIFSGDNSKEEYRLDENTKIDRNKPLAEIENEEILYQDWMDQLVRLYGEKVLTDLIDQEVVFQLAEKEDIDIHPKIIERELSRMMIMQGLQTPEEREQQITKWTEQIKFRYFLQYLLTEDISIPESEIEEYYNTFQNQYQFDDMIQLSHILVSNQQEAELVIAKLEEGMSFAQVANEYSSDTETAGQGGYLGYYSETSSFIPDQYYEEAISIDEGTYSEPLSVGSGYAIIFHHQHLSAIQLSYDEAYQEVRQDIALDRMETDVDPSILREQLEVDLIYKE
ncbi:peptidylprolyl isomerase [Gracilibacillus kekensis]|uniref:peptidylprolyl isomerase n=1 Tax=Gracilibacillus kekensis TaxID=1027249 RepID=A0A1M7QZ15_9BACI|nr:peptidylprolyl isomerase [Gracilibacillus kekensis]SHN37387.1 Parvulin-like peptidyl-prolyl isomerase [Gracilibacillus kekensis]